MSDLAIEGSNQPKLGGINRIWQRQKEGKKVFAKFNENPP